MNFYLYLLEQSHADIWVNGGRVPLRLASAYLSNNREGIYTPDENKIRLFSGDISELDEYRAIGGSRNNKNVVIENLEVYKDDGILGMGLKIVGSENITVKNMTIGNPTNKISYKGSFKEDSEDILIFCVSTVFSKTQADRFKKPYCVEIKGDDVSRLKKFIDSQIGTSTFEQCKYTLRNHRSHTLKHIEDSWQKEYRMMWPISNDIKKKYTKDGLWVDIPKGISTQVFPS